MNYETSTLLKIDYVRHQNLQKVRTKKNIARHETPIKRVPSTKNQSFSARGRECRKNSKLATKCCTYAREIEGRRLMIYRYSKRRVFLRTKHACTLILLAFFLLNSDGET